MKIIALKELDTNEKRISVSFAVIQKYIALGCEIHVESDIGKHLLISDQDFLNAGAKIFTDKKEALSIADIVIRVKKPAPSEVPMIRPGAYYISFLDPFNEKALIEQFAKNNISSISLEMIPRTTLAQKMDALSSQANLSGYMSVIVASYHYNKIFPMMTTPAGTITPSKLFVLGAGVAGLQAIATARRLGAKVEAFDVRPSVEEQIKSLGAKFIKIAMPAQTESKTGYAQALTKEEIERQRRELTKILATQDIIITTAQLFGKPAPRLITEEMLNYLKKGTVIVDLAVDSGGNVEGSKPFETVERNGIKIIGAGHLSSMLASSASELFSANIFNYISHFYDKKKKEFYFDPNDPILKSSLLTYNGKIVNETILGAK